MTFEADLKGVLDDVTTRVFPGFAPVTTARPYVTYQQIGGDVINPLANSAPGKRNSVLQVNVWADTHAQALSLSRSIEDALRAASLFQARPVSAAAIDFDADIPVYGARQDFTCWHTT
jgi:hypothetical protein